MQGTKEVMKFKKSRKDEVSEERRGRNKKLHKTQRGKRDEWESA